MEEFNLLVTFHPNQAGLAEREIRHRIEEVGGSIEDLERSSVEGVFCIKVAGDPKELVAHLRSNFQEEPGLFTHTYHWVPIDRWVPANEEAMVRAVSELGEGIRENDKWMMHLHKRHTVKHSEELVKTLTDPIMRGPVDLKNPDKILVVEILGDLAGIALVNKRELLDINRMRQEIGLTRII